MSATLQTKSPTPAAPIDPAPPDPAQAEPTRGALSNRSIASATVVVMLFFVLSRVAGLAREQVIAALFGTGSLLDAYIAAFRIPDLLFQLVAGGALGSAFIPTFSALWNSGLGNSDESAEAGQQQAWLLFSRVLNWVTLLLVGLAALAAIFALPLVQSTVGRGFDGEQQRLTAELMRWMLLSTVVFGASGLIMGALNAAQHFLLPAAAPVLYNVAIILGALFLVPRYGPYGLVIGVIAGALAHLLVQVPGLWRQGARYRPSFAVDHHVREVGVLMGPRVLGLLFVQLHFLVNVALAGGEGDGAVSALNYAFLLMLLPQGVFAQAVATTVFPTFAAQVAAGRRDEMRRTFGQVLRTVLLLTVPAAAGLFVLRVPLIQLLFERVNFTADSTRMVAYALQFYAFGLIAHSALEIVVRAFYALHDTLTPVAVGVGAMALNIGLSFLWIGPLSYGGLALANTVATTLEVGLLLWLLRHRLGGLDARRLLASLARIAAATAVMSGALWAWLRWLSIQSLFVDNHGWLAAIGGVGIAVVVYGGVHVLLRSEEVQLVRGLARR